MLESVHKTQDWDVGINLVICRKLWLLRFWWLLGTNNRQLAAWIAASGMPNEPEFMEVSRWWYLLYSGATGLKIEYLMDSGENESL